MSNSFLDDMNYSFTANCVFDALQYQQKVDFIGFVEQTNSLILSGGPIKRKLLRFTVNNSLGRTIDCCLEGETAQYHVKHIIPNTIIYVEGATVLGINTHLRFLLDQNSIIKPLGKYFGPSGNSTPVFRVVEWSDLPLSEGAFVALRGFVKFPFGLTQQNGNTCAVGAVTDGFLKLTVKIASIEGLSGNWEKGELIELRGRICEDDEVAKRLSIEVTNGFALSRSEGARLSLDQVLTVTKNVENVREIIAVVRRVDAITSVGRVKKFTLFKFQLDNMRGRQVQGCAWGESASMCSQMATLNAILHIEGARSKLIEANQRQFNGGNVNFELNINITTVLENVGVWSDDVREDMQVYTPTRWEDLSFSADPFIAVEAWIKNVFRNAQIDGHPGATGTITDGRRKLLVRVVNDAGLIEDIERGFPVEIRGQLLEEPYVPNRLFLRVPSGARVDRREGQPIPFEQLILINANVHREIRPAVPVVEPVVVPVVVPVVQPIVQPIVKPFVDPEAEPEDDDI